MHYYVLLAIGCSSYSSCFSQNLSPTVIASAGTSAQNGTVVLESTIAEPLTNVFNAGSNQLTQGFHQPIVSTIGFADWEAAQVQLFPNPANQTVQLILPENTYQSAIIYDATGKLIWNIALTEPIITINTNQLLSGIYSILLQGKNEKLLHFIKR